MLASRFRSRSRRHRSRGQSLVELALVLPVLLLLLLTAIDFGRVYLGWVNLNNLARIAANFAANDPTAWTAPQDAAALANYQRLVKNDAAVINCDLPPAGPTNNVPAPQFPTGTDIGDTAVVEITCSFGIITPVISDILGNSINVTAKSTFPVKTGGVSGIPVGGGGGVNNAPVAEFIGAPLSGTAPLSVTFTDQSTNAPTAWTWQFGDGGSANGQGPQTHVYNNPGTYTVSLLVSNAAGTDQEVKSGYVVVNPPAGGALQADFTANQTSGNAPLSVTFTDASTSTGAAINSWSWDFGNGITRTTQGPHTITYNLPGTYTVSLTVGNGSDPNDTETRTDYVVVGVAQCVVPNVSDGFTRKNTATATLTSRGFAVQQVGGNGNWLVRSQSPQGGLVVACGSTVQIFQN